MTNLSDLGPPIPSKRRGAEPTARQVFYHEAPGHDPLELEGTAKVLPFPAMRRLR